MKAKKVRFIKPAMVSHESRGLRGDFGRKGVEGVRAFLVMTNEVEMVENGRKWSKKVHRGYMVGNGFSRRSRHSPTTIRN